MKELGNKKIVTKKGQSIQIAEPKAAIDLLNLAVESAKEGRRVIYFCSCVWPRCDGKIACHRSTVAGLLRKAAGKQNKSVEIVEWPGGKSQRIDLDVKPAVFHAVEKGRMSIPLGKRVNLSQMAGLGAGSIASLHCGDEAIHRLVGPVMWKTDQWMLPVLYYFFDASTSLAEYRKEAVKFRRATGLEPQVG